MAYFRASRPINGPLHLTSTFRHAGFWLSSTVSAGARLRRARVRAWHCRIGRAGARKDQISHALVDALLRSPLQIPSLVLGIAFLQYVAWINQNMGFDLRGSFLALLVAHTTVAIPFVLTIVLARLSSFDHTLEEAAHGLGASPIVAFLLVTLPNIAPALVAGAFFAFLLSLDNVPLSLFLVGPGMNLLPVDLFTTIQFGLTRTVYAVATLVCIGTTLLVVVFYARAASFAVIGRT